MSDSGSVFARRTSGLRKTLSWFDVFIVTVAAPAGSGILYFSVNMQTKCPGGSVGLAFLIGLFLFLPVCYVVAVISGGIPRAGSLYVAISRVIGPHIAYIAAILFFVGQSMAAGVLGHIIVAVIGGVLSAVGSTTSTDLLLTVGNVLSSYAGKLVGGICWVAFFWLVTLGGMRVYRRVMRLFFYVPLVATFCVILLFTLTSPQGAEDSFNNTWGDGAFGEIVSASDKAGWNPSPFSFASTISLLLIVLFAYNGFEMASYASGEVSDTKRSMVRGFFAGWVVVGLIYVVLAFVVFRPFGDFISRYDYLYRTDQASLSSIMPDVSPSVPLYAISIAPNVWIGLVIALAIVLWFANCIPPVFLSTSRLVFALAMDRTLPEKLADVHPKTGAPTWATHIAAIFALAGVLLQSLEASVVLGTLTFCTFFIFWLYGFAAMLLPFRRKDLYSEMVLKTNVLSMPLLSLAGFATFVFGWFVVFFTLRQITLGVAAALTVIIAVAGMLYLIQWKRNSSSGLDPDIVYQDLPPI